MDSTAEKPKIRIRTAAERMELFKEKSLEKSLGENRYSFCRARVAESGGKRRKQSKN